MPELPDVEVFRRHAADTSLNREIERIHVSEKRLLEDISPQGLGRRLKGQQFESTHRHGKYLLLETKNGLLVLHFGMTGDLKFVEDSKQLPEYTRGEFHFTDDGCLACLSRRLLGRIFFVEDVDELIEKKELGPDALDIDAERFCELIRQKKGSLKAALMDQSLLAGIGNVYSDDILFQLRLHPGTDLADLDRDDLKQLYETMQRVLKTAIRHHAHADEMPSDYLLPHREGGGICPRCENKLEKIKVGGRNAVSCPNCQPLRK